MKIPHGGYTPKIAGKPESRIDEISLHSNLQIVLERKGLQYKPVVKNGEAVTPGQSIAEASTEAGVFILPSPATGRISATHEEPRKIIIEQARLDGKFNTGEKFEPDRITTEQMMQQLGRSGTWSFFSDTHTGTTPAISGEKRPSAIIVNCVIAEPFRARGKVVLNHSWNHFIQGIKFLPRLLKDYGKVEIILTAVHDPVAKKLYRQLAGFAWTRLHAVPVTYPIEIPQVLRQTLRKTARSYSSQDTIWCIDVQGMAAVGACLGDGIPLHNRLVALGGPGIQHPRHVLVGVGTPIKHIVQKEDLQDRALVLRNGLLRGKPVDPESDSVQYDDDAFFFLPIPTRREMLSFLRPGFRRTSYTPAFTSRLFGASDTNISTSTRGERRPCITCGSCEKICPAGILPQVLHRYIHRELFDEAEKIGLHRCIDCNLCTFVCPSKLELQKQFEEAREQLRREHAEAQQAAADNSSEQNQEGK